MATFTWTNASGGNWDNQANWSPTGVPSAENGDVALIAKLGTYTVTSTGDVFYDVTLSAPGLTLQLSPDGGLTPLLATIDDSFVQQSGTLVLGPDLANQGTSPTGSAYTIGGNGTLVADGTVILDQTQLNSAANGETIVIDPSVTIGGLFEVAGSPSLAPTGITFSNGVAITSSGTLVVSSDGSSAGGLYGSGSSSNAGKLLVNGAIAQFTNPFTNAAGATITVSNYATLDVGTDDGTGNIVGAAITNGGTLVLSNNSTIAADSIGVASGSHSTIVFSDGLNNEIVLTGDSKLVATVYGFRAGDSIDLVGANFAGDKIVISGNVLNVKSGTVIDATLTMADLTAAQVSSFGYMLEDDQNSYNGYVDSGGTPTDGILLVACFAAGTRIATPRGEVAVDQLAAGDLIDTELSGPQRVVWIGQRNVDIGRHPRPELVTPIRIAPGAFGTRLPARELLLSPEHAVFIDGMLVPVRCLVNGATITRAPADRVSYFHVELECHDVLLAEGLPCETYLDCGNRGGFANGGDFMALHPDFMPRNWTDDACAELHEAGPRVEAARTRLRRRAERLGHAVSADPDLHIEIAGRRIGPDSVADGVWRFRVPAGTGRVVLRSRVGYAESDGPATFGLYPLGVKLARIVQHAGTRAAEIALDDRALARGFYDLERGPDGNWRWTDGAAVIALTLAGAEAIEVHVTATHAYLCAPAADAPAVRQAA